MLAVLGLLFGFLKVVERFAKPHPELLRKLLHVGTGLIVISFPWIFTETWPVLLLAGLSAGLLLAVKYLPRYRDGIGTVMTGVHRPSLGEICFPAAVASLILLSRGDKLLFAVPLLIMTLADAVAALVGIAYGKLRYVTSEGLKSAEGSIAFFSIAFLSVHVPLLLFTNVGRTETLLIAVIIGLLSTLLEAIAARGLDNLLIPLGAYAFLRLYLDATPNALLLRLIVTASLVIFALAWRRRTNLNDSALMAAALYGYAAGMLGGWPWLIGPIVLFLAHVCLWPRTTDRRGDTVMVVVAVTGPGLVWLAAQVADPSRHWLIPYAAGFACHLTIIGVSRISTDPRKLPRLIRLGGAILSGWLLFSLQILPTLLGGRHHIGPIPLQTLTIAIGCVVAAGVLYFRLLTTLYGPGQSKFLIHASGFMIALVLSTMCAVAIILH